MAEMRTLRLGVPGLGIQATTCLHYTIVLMLDASITSCFTSLTLLKRQEVRAPWPDHLGSHLLQCCR